MANGNIFDGTKWNEQFHTEKNALADRPPKEYLAYPVFPLPSLCLVYGISGSHKTNLIVDLAACVRYGKFWLVGENGSNFVGFKTIQTSVMWIDVDSGIETLDERLGAALRAHGKPDHKNFLHYISFPDPIFAATNAAAKNEVIRRALEWKCRLIVFDNLGTVSGGMDENTNQMVEVMSGLRFIAQKSNACVIAIHHDTKQERGRKTPRGHSSIEAALDLALWITSDDNVITAAPTKTRHAKFDPFVAEWHFTHRGNTLDLKTAEFIGNGFTLDPITQRAKRLIFDFLSKNGEGNQSQLIGLAKGNLSQQRMRSEIRKMEIGNEIKVRPHQERNQKVYSLPETCKKNKKEIPAPTSGLGFLETFSKRSKHV